MTSYEWANHVKQGAVSDLHASFMAPRSVSAAASDTKPKETQSNVNVK